MRPKLTKRQIDEIKPDPVRDIFLWCGEVRGFGIRIKPKGSRTFLVQYRTRRGQTRRLALGSFGVLTVDGARTLAKTQLTLVAEGKDVSRDRSEARAFMTVAALCDAYLADVESGRVLPRGKRKKPSTILNDRSRIERHIKPVLGKRPVNDIERRDIEALMADIIAGKTRRDLKTKPRGRSIVRGGSGTAVKAIKLLSTIFGYAVRKGHVRMNPCLGIDKPADGRRQRFLTAAEYQRLGDALRDAPSRGVAPQLVQAIWLLCLTGCRKGEILTLRPDDVHVEGHCLRLRDSKSGPQMRPCGEVALGYLERITDRQSAWVLPSVRGHTHLVDLTSGLASICTQAQLADVSAHTFRHSYATVAHELNYSELTIAGLLGHSAGTVTARYAHHVDHALASAADRVAAAIADRMGLTI